MRDNEDVCYKCYSLYAMQSSVVKRQRRLMAEGKLLYMCCRGKIRRTHAGLRGTRRVKVGSRMGLARMNT